VASGAPRFGERMMQPSNSSFFLPPQASTFAPGYDLLFNALTALLIFCFTLIMAAMVYFVWKYRHRDGAQKAVEIHHNTALEVTWSVVPLFVVMGLFVWGFKNYLDMVIPPKDAIEIRVTGQKWSWSFEYENGATSASEMAVPIHKPVKLIMTSRDVLHAFFIPSFRTKLDVVPNKFNVMWFEATQYGPQQVFCAEYCGTDHSKMMAKVLVLDDKDYNDWLQRHLDDPKAPPAAKGEKLFATKGCNACHAVKPESVAGQPAIGPRLWNAFGRQETMSDGLSLTIDENYIRESIEYPNKKTVAGFAGGQMPTFKGLLSDQQISYLIAYIKSLK
jgi:cytochrome c oxidase subunit 2